MSKQALDPLERFEKLVDRFEKIVNEFSEVLSKIEGQRRR